MSEEAMLTLMAENRKLRAEIAALREAVRCVYFRRDTHGGMLDTRADGVSSIDALSDESVAAVRRALEEK